MKALNTINNFLWTFFYIAFAAFAVVFNKTGTWVSLYFLTLLFIINIITLLQDPKHLSLVQSNQYFQPTDEEENKLSIQFQSDKRMIIPHGKVTITLGKQKIQSQNFSSLFDRRLEVFFLEDNFQRGIYSEVDVEFFISDFFGIFKRSFRRSLPLRLTILPKLLKNEASSLRDFLIHYQHELTFELDETNYDIKKIRPYLPGDRVNQIDWKLTSKKQELFYKEYERDKISYPIFIFLGQYQHDYEYSLSLYYSFIESYGAMFNKDYYLFENKELMSQPTKNQFSSLINEESILTQLTDVLEVLNKDKTLILFTTYPDDRVLTYIKQLSRKRPILLIHPYGTKIRIVSSSTLQTYEVSKETSL